MKPDPTVLPTPGAVLLVDASAYLFRAWFGVPDVFFDRRGRPLNAVVGFAKTLSGLLRLARPSAVAVAFDASLFSGFRHCIDPAYKSNRCLPDADLDRQMQACRQLVERLGLRAVASCEFEADDIIATLAHRVARAGGRSVLAGEDKDLAQALVGPSDQLWQFGRNRVLDRSAAAAWLGVDPARLPELQALTGDAVDAIAGVPGIGVRTAQVLVAHCGHIAELLAEPERVATLPLRGAPRVAAALKEHRERVRTNLRLTTLSRAATGMPRLPALRFRPPSPAQVDDVMASLDLPPGSARGFHLLQQEQDPC